MGLNVQTRNEPCPNTTLGGLNVKAGQDFKTVETDHGCMGNQPSRLPCVAIRAQRQLVVDNTHHVLWVIGDRVRIAVQGLPHPGEHAPLASCSDLGLESHLPRAALAPVCW